MTWLLAWLVLQVPLAIIVGKCFKHNAFASVDSSPTDAERRPYHTHLPPTCRAPQLFEAQT